MRLSHSDSLPATHHPVASHQPIQGRQPASSALVFAVPLTLRCWRLRASSVINPDLQFFEPYLWVVLVEWGLTLGQIGLLVSVEKVTCYLFELPSGYLADRWGMRKELCLCFVFYIVAFILYYFGRNNFGDKTHIFCAISY